MILWILIMRGILHNWYCFPKNQTFKSFKGGLTRPRTPWLGFAISKTTRDIFMQQHVSERSWAPQLACTYNLDASVFYIALVLLHECFTPKAKLLPYTTELSLQTCSISLSQQSQCNDKTFYKYKFDFSPSMTSLQAL